MKKGNITIVSFPSDAWIGATRESNIEAYVWGDSGEFVNDTYHDWNPGEPSFGNDNCSYVNQNGKWDDNPCNTKRRYICVLNKVLNETIF